MKPASGPTVEFKPCRVLVCDGEERAALAVVRALGRRGHAVAICSHESRSIAGASKWALERFAVPSPLSPLDDFASSVLDASARWRADIVMPVTDQSSLALLGARGAFAPAAVPGPSLDAFMRVSDKRALMSVAAGLGIAIPRQVVLERRDPDAPELRDVAFPVVLKPTRSVAGRVHHYVTYAASPATLRQRVLAAPDDAFPLLLQERIIGPGIGIFLLIQDQRAVAVFAHERLREQPPSGGRSVYCESIAAPQALVDQSTRLLLAHGWEGAAMVEFKRDAATGRVYLMEVNGRLWGSLQLAIDAGVDFPSLMVDAARGRVAPIPPPYRVGMRLRSFWGDLDLLSSRLRYSPARLDLPPGTPGKLRAFLDFFRWSPRERSQVFRWGDMAPFTLETSQFLSRKIWARKG